MEQGKPFINSSGYIISSEKKKIPVTVSTSLLIDKKGDVIGGVETFRDHSLVEQLRKELTTAFRVEDIISNSDAMKKIFSILPQVSDSDSSVLIEGETGTGKELLARAIHNMSPRKNKPFIAINCGALPDTLLESELFGYKKGAFTGADRDKSGLFKEADGGTIFLDEIGELPLTLQVKLLRVLQDREIRPIGDARIQKVDVRVIAATSKNLEEEVARRTFREDLFYRLNVMTLKLPPLRERMEDIPVLIRLFIQKFNQEIGRQIQGVSPPAMAALLTHDWPGNVRELENVIERAVVLAETQMILPENLPESLGRTAPPPITGFYQGFSLKEAQKIMEKQLIENALDATDGNRTKAGKLLEISHPSLLSKIKSYHIDK
jgi:transcriptional regulator with PAS, ATPase and Fis domain